MIKTDFLNGVTYPYKNNSLLKTFRPRYGQDLSFVKVVRFTISLGPLNNAVNLA